MIDLSKYCISVTSDYERKVAINFYLLSTEFPFNIHSPDNGRYVGVCYGFGIKRNEIACSNEPNENETIISFSQISDLADTPERVTILQKARTSYVTTNPDKEI